MPAPRPWSLRLAEKAGIPTTMTLMGLGAVPMDHPRAIGMLGMHAARYTNMALEACDVLIAAGVRFDDRATGKVAAFCPNARIIHIDIDASELHKIKTAHVGIVGDVRQVLAALLPLVTPQAADRTGSRISTGSKRAIPCRRPVPTIRARPMA